MLVRLSRSKEVRPSANGAQAERQPGAAISLTRASVQRSRPNGKFVAGRQHDDIRSRPMSRSRETIRALFV